MRCFLWLLVLPGSLGKPLSMTEGTIKAWEGSCVFISCHIRREYNKRPIEHVSFAWYFDASYHSELKDYSGKLLYNSNQTAYLVSPEFSNRVTFVGDLKNKNCSLRISQLHQNDSGMYSIRLYWKGGELFEQGKWFQGVSIQVYESPLELIELVSPEMRENMMNKVTCSVPYSCFYEPVTLTIQGLEGHRLLFQKMTSENQRIQTELSLRPTWQDHKKQLTCLLKTHDGTEIEKKITELDVEYAPKGVRLKATPAATVREGGNLSLECTANSSNPDVLSYQWFKDDITWDLQFQPKKSFSGLKETDSGNYKCSVNNWIGSTSSDNLMISVQYLPKVKILMPQSPIREKDNVVLSCSATGNPPITGYEWYKSSTPEIIVSKKELRFEPIEARHSGTYRCVVRNEIGNSNSSVTLNVHYCPKDVQLFHLNHLPIKEGDKVILNCSVGSSFPRNTWYKILRSGDYTQKTQDSPILMFFATATPVPSYQCEACNIVGCTTSPSITLDILYGPKDVKLNQEPSGWVIEGNSVRLTCTVRIANPQELSYTWYKDGQLLPLNSTKNMIFIQNVHSTNSGIYRCTSENAISIAESPTLRLDVHYGPRNVRLTLDTQKAVTEGTDVYLRCDNDAYPSAVRYKWYWKGQEIFKETSKILALQKIKVEQSGEYLCKAFNHVSNKESQLMTISVSYRRATQMKQALIGLGVCLSLIILLGLLLYVLKIWKKTIRSNSGSTQRSGSFFVKKAKREVLTNNNCRPNEGRTDSPQALQDEEQEGTISYARLQFPPTGSKEHTVYSRVMNRNLAPDSSNDRVIYSVVKKPELPPKNDTKVDYENVVNKEEEELHYSSLVNLTPWSRPINADLETDSESEDSIQYAALKH